MFIFSLLSSQERLLDFQDWFSLAAKKILVRLLMLGLVTICGTAVIIFLLHQLVWNDDIVLI